MNALFIEAKFRVVAQATGVLLYPDQTILVACYASAMPTEAPPLARQQIALAQIETRIRQEAVTQFILQLRRDTALKRRVGGTKWSIVLPNEVMNFVWYTDLAQIGTIDKLIDTRNPYRIVEELQKRNFALLSKYVHEGVQA